MEFDSKCFGDDKIGDAVSASSSEYGGESSMNIKDRPCKSDQTVNSNGKTDMLNVRCIQDEYDSESDADGILVDRMENKYVGESNGKFNLPDFGQPQRNIGSVTIQNSAHPMFGNKTFYKGQITINHIVYDAENSNQNEQHANEYAEYEEQTSDDANLIPKESTQNENHSERGREFGRWSYKNSTTIALCGCSLFVAFFLVLILVYYNSEFDKPPTALRIISREEWNALPPKNRTKLELPSIRVIIAHTDMVDETCSEESACASIVRQIQLLHMRSNNWDDIAYNFLVGGDGAVYVGRGWDNEGAHTKHYNKRSICIAFIGNFIDKLPPKRQLDAAQKMIARGVELGKLSTDYSLYGQCQLKPTDSPGAALYKEVQKWKHWTDGTPNPISSSHSPYQGIIQN